MTRCRGPYIIPWCKSRLAAAWLADNPGSTISEAGRRFDVNPGGVVAAWNLMFPDLQIGQRERAAAGDPESDR
jgi:hypothetical protein